MAIKIGNTDISAFKVGSGDCKIYLGDTLLYPTTPSFDGKWLATYSDSDSHTESAACDSTSAITRGEIEKTNLVDVQIGQCVTSIGGEVFRDCTSLTSCTIGSGVTTIGNQAFYQCRSLTSVIIPDSVTSIGGNAFNTCTGLISCTIGSGVTIIGGTAFSWCTNLTSFTIKAITPPTLGRGIFSYSSNCPIYVPDESVNAYKTASGWSDYADRIQAIP